MTITAKPPNCFMQLRERGYEYHVFISWPHSIQAQGQKLIEQLFEGLEDRFRNFGGGKVFLDKQRLEPGEQWDPKLRRSVCRSGVLVAILVDSYFLSKYCRIEWNITETLQKKRLPQKETDATCFIPIIFQEDVALPIQLRAIQCDRSFAKMRSYTRNLKLHSKWNEALDALVARIKSILTLMCQQPTGNQDWVADESKAEKVEPKDFNWETASTHPNSPHPRRKLPRAVSRGSKL